MNRAILEEAVQRGITRLCHFTPSRNLAHILSGGLGILATKHLKDDERALYNATDLARLDGHEDHICCSIEYPNAWYFDRAKDREPLFRDWVVLLINPRYLWEDGTKFCPRNAAILRRGLNETFPLSGDSGIRESNSARRSYFWFAPQGGGRWLGVVSNSRKTSDESSMRNARAIPISWFATRC